MVRFDLFAKQNDLERCGVVIHLEIIAKTEIKLHAVRDRAVASVKADANRSAKNVARSSAKFNQVA
jgi:hypothetical protein